MHCYIGAHVGACSVALVRMWVYALLHWCACGCIRSLALCAEDAIAAHCAEHLLLYMFVDALAAHCAEHILLYIRHVFRVRKFMLALTLGSSALSSSYRVGLAGRLHHLLRAAASARMASDFGESPWESPELAGDDSQADSVSTVPVRRPANAAPPSPDSIWTQASSLSFRSLGPKPKDISQLADLGQAVLQGPLAARWKRCDAKLGKLTHGSMQARPHSEPPERGGAAFCDDGRHELLESAASPSTKRPRYVLPTATPTKNRPLKRHHTTGSCLLYTSPSPRDRG